MPGSGPGFPTSNSNQLPNTKYYKQAAGAAQIPQTEHSTLAGDHKVAEAGLRWYPLGDPSTAIRVGYRTPVLIYNPTAGDLFVNFGPAGVAAPTSGANGMPVLSKSVIVYNSGYDAYIRSSGAGLFAYTGDPENTQISATNPNELDGTADSEKASNVPTGPATLASQPPGK